MNNDIAELLGQLQKTQTQLERNFELFDDLKTRFINAQGKETVFAMALSQVFNDFTPASKLCYFAFHRFSRTTSTKPAGINPYCAR